MWVCLLFAGEEELPSWFTDNEKLQELLNEAEQLVSIIEHSFVSKLMAIFNKCNYMGRNK
jgi:hypothetical protein